MSDYDLIVIGGGPAGAAAAITACRDGLSVLVLESAGGRRFRPGETLAPGTVALLADLLGREALARLPGLAYHAIVTHDRRGVRAHRDRFATPGMHFLRADLDQALLLAAARAGAQVQYASPASSLHVSHDHSIVSGPRIRAGARMLLDCSGRSRWLSRQLGLPFIALSHPLEVRYGYAPCACTAPPQFRTDAMGWHWSAAIGQGQSVDCRMRFDGAPSGGPRRSDGTWAIAAQLASPHFLLAGDAACSVDPAAAHGVLRALVSGQRAARAAAAFLDGAPGDPLLDYCDLLTHWFFNDCCTLHAYYRVHSGLPDPVGYQARRQHFLGSFDDFTRAGDSAVGAAVC